MNDCIFCNIIAGSIPAERLHEDDETLAFLSIGPNNPGHALVIPKFHAATLYEMSDESLTAVMKVVKKVANAVKAATYADGINIVMNNEPAAGQVIFHAHVHVIPRHEGDGYKHWPEGVYAEGEAKIVADTIRNALTT